MTIDWSPFVDIVRQSRHFLLTTHVRPDGDGLGSMLALGEGLWALGKQVQMTVASIYPPRYRFLDPEGRVSFFQLPGEEYRKAEVVVVLDTGTWSQLGNFGVWLRESPAAKIVIDHHQTQDDLNALRLVDTSAEATGRLAHEALAALDLAPTPGMANALFVALAMDTGWYRHSNATPRTFALASELVAAGATPTALYEELFERNTLARLKLTGLILDRLQLACEGRVAYTELHRGDYEATGAVPQDSEDMVNYTRSVAGVEVGLFFMEQPRGGIKVSFRSRGRVDVARLAEQFGGGGHRQASGAVLQASLEDARRLVLQRLAEALASAS